MGVCFLIREVLISTPLLVLALLLRAMVISEALS